MLGRRVHTGILILVGFILLSEVILQLRVSSPESVIKETKLNVAIANVTTQHFSDVSARPFPRWDDGGIEFQRLVDFIHGTLNKSVTTVVARKPRSRFPETLYVVDGKGVWVSRTLRQRNWNLMRTKRVDPTESIFVLAWKILVKDNVLHPSTRWKRLRQALKESGFPFLSWFGDYKSCNYRNWAGKHSIPLLTTCAPIWCNHAFPLPAYQVILDSQKDAVHWHRVMKEYQTKYPWQSKISKLVWRGSLSAPNEHWNSTRWRVCVLANSLNEAIGDRLDIGLVSIPSINSHLKSQINWTSIGGGLKPPIEPMEAFQRYVAILDMDGNAWSSRFASELCYASIVVKVQPDYIEYFYQGLVPWKHYIPVRADLSDFAQAALFVTDPKNQESIQEIVSNANQWCQEHLTLTALAEDLLDIWEIYVMYLDLGDHNWPQVWTSEKAAIFGSDFDMVKLEDK